jgi:DNA-binding GntR family transcriptional regulator
MTEAHPAEELSLAPIGRGSLKETAMKRIRKAISNGELTPGERVTELGLARIFGVGQATIREALIELEHQGFIQRDGLTKTITRMMKKDIDDLYVVRERMEMLAIELLAAARVREIPECREACSRMAEAAQSADEPAFCDADLAFHRGLWRATNNRPLWEALEKIVPRIFALDVISPEAFSQAKLHETAALHLRLLGHLAAGRQRAAKDLMRTSMKMAQSEDEKLSIDRQAPNKRP